MHHAASSVRCIVFKQMISLGFQYTATYDINYADLVRPNVQMNRKQREYLLQVVLLIRRNYKQSDAVVIFKMRPEILFVSTQPHLLVN